MSFQQDYVLRAIQDMTAFLTRVVQLRREQRDEDALLLLADQTSNISGIPPSLIYALSDDDLIETLQARGALEATRLYVLAELFREEGSIYVDRGEQAEALLRLSKGARLYAEALGRSEGDDSLPSLIGVRSLLESTHAADLPTPTLRMLIEELLRRDQFEMVDNILYELLQEQSGDDVSSLLAEGYRSMLRASDEQLAAAGLGRGEIEASLSQVAV